MIELKSDAFMFRFPEFYAEARCRIDFQRTLRILDDNRDYPLPPGMGCFPVSHVDDYRADLPEDWLRHGGVFLPRYQSEALWVMRQEVCEDDYGYDAWDQTAGSRCFVHITNSLTYFAITGHRPPHEPPTAKEYTNDRLPWFEYYSADRKALS